MALAHGGRLHNEGLQDFIVRGYHVIEPTVPAAYHEAILEQLREREAGGLGGQALADAVPLDELWADPAVEGALTSVFGHRWALDHHRHVHQHGPGAGAQTAHKDGAMRGRPRAHRPRLGLVMYYPQAVDESMGPTAILPGSQYLLDKNDAEWPEIKLTCAAGTVVITHYDTFHRATENVSDTMRYMMKFIVWRRAEPEPHAPSWLPGDGIELHGQRGGLAALPWRPPTAATTNGMPHSAVIWRTVWEWYTCDHEPEVVDGEEAEEEEATSAELSAALSSPSLAERRLAADRSGALHMLSQELRAALGECLSDRSTDGQLRMLAAYSLGRGGGLTELTEALRHEAQAVAAGPEARYYDSTEPLAGHAEDGAPDRPYDSVMDSAPTGASGHSWRNPGQVDAAFGLAAAGAVEGAVPALCQLVQGGDWPVAAAATTALGEMGVLGAAATRPLVDALMSPSEWVARGAAEALGTVGVTDTDDIGEAAIALAFTVEEDRQVTPWSLARYPLREAAACSLARMELAFGAVSTVAQRAKATLLERLARRAGGEEPNAYVQQWINDGDDGPRARL